MRILVYGSGAVGGYLGGKLAQAGNEITLVARPVVADAINDDGLRITEAGQTVKSQPTAVSSIARAFMEGAASYDLIILAMKSYDLKAALDPLIAFCPEPAAVITTQNGIGIEEIVSSNFETNRLTTASITTPIIKESTNHLVVESTDRGLALAPVQAGQSVKQWANLFQEAGLTTQTLRNYRAMKWSKVLLNILGNASSAILNRSPAVLYKSSAIFQMEVGMVREALRVMKALKLKAVDLPGAPTGRLVFGVRYLPQFLLQPIMTQLLAHSGRGDKMPSFHMDLTAGKGKSEVVFHNGAIANAGRQLNIPTPINAALTDILLKLSREELDWRDYDGNAKRLLADMRRYKAR
jgi:2-dehydropantoate 2-reductase